MNYRYVVGNEDIILSEEEHRKVTTLQTEGEGRVVFLRNGTLGLNPAHIKSVHETEQPTTKQEKERSERLRLETSEKMTGGIGALKESHFSFYEKMGWSHDSKDCFCKTQPLSG